MSGVTRQDTINMRDAPDLERSAEIYPGIVTGMVDGTGLTVTMN